MKKQEIPKERVTIRLDEDVLEYYRNKSESNATLAGYQTLINQALRERMEQEKSNEAGIYRHTT